MWLILQHHKADDFVIATGGMHSVREFCTAAFQEVGIPIFWEGNGADETGINEKNGEVIIKVDRKYFRPAEVDQLLGDPSKAKAILAWNPTKTSFSSLIKEMVCADMKLVETENHIRKSFD
jgi:GDPmannose 4,6-dehydratase